MWSICFGMVPPLQKVPPVVLFLYVFTHLRSSHSFPGNWPLLTQVWVRLRCCPPRFLFLNNRITSVSPPMLLLLPSLFPPCFVVVFSMSRGWLDINCSRSITPFREVVGRSSRPPLRPKPLPYLSFFGQLIKGSAVFQVAGPRFSRCVPR